MWIFKNINWKRFAVAYVFICAIMWVLLFSVGSAFPEELGYPSPEKISAIQKKISDAEIILAEGVQELNDATENYNSCRNTWNSINQASKTKQAEEDQALTILNQAKAKAATAANTLGGIQVTYKGKMDAISNATAYTSKLVSTINTIKGTRSTYQKSIERLQTQVNAVKARLVEQETALGKARQFMGIKEAEEREARSRASELGKSVRNVTDKATRASKLMSAATNRLEVVSGVMVDANKSISNLESEIKELTVKVANTIAREKNAKAVAMQPVEMKEIDTSGMEEAEIVAALQEQTRKQQDAQEKMDKELRDSTEARIVIERTFKNKTEKLAGLKRDVETLESEKETKLIEIDELKKKVEDAKETISVLNGELKTARAAVESAVQETLRARNTVSQRETETGTRRKELSDVSKELESILAKDKAAFETQAKTDQSINTVVDQIEKAKGEAAGLLIEIEKTNKLVLEANANVQNTNLSYRQRRVERVKIEVEKKLAEEDYRSSDVRYRDAQAEAKRADAFLKQLKSDLQRMEDWYNKAKRGVSYSGEERCLIGAAILR